MKKLSCLLLAVVILAGMMVVPAWAAPIYDESYRATFDGAVNAVFSANASKLPSGFRYYYAFIYDANGNIIFWITDSPVIQYGTKFYSSAYTVSTGRASSISSTAYTHYESDFINGSIKMRFYGVNGDLGTYTTTTPVFSIFAASTATLSYRSGNTEDYMFYFAPPPVNKTALQSLVTTATAVTDTGYTQQSWEAFQDKLSAGQSMLTNNNATQSEVDAATAALQSAMDGLEIYIPPPPESSQPPRPPNIDGEYAVPPSMLDAVSTGSITGMLSGFIGPFVSHAMSALPQVIGIFSIIIGIKMIPRVLKMFFSSRRL